MRLRINGLILAALPAVFLMGCGGGDEAGPTPAGGEPAASPGGDGAEGQSPEGGSSQSATKGKTGLPTAAIPALPKPEEEELKITRPLDGTPEALILQITQLRLKPFSSSDPDTPPSEEDVKNQRAARQKRNEQIIELAQEAIAMTHQAPEKEQVFNIAVHRLMDATLELALQGDQESADQLYGHAESLFSRDPKSKAASEAAWFVARYSNENAQRFAGQDIRWVEEFSRQSRSFATKFPHDPQRAVGLLNEASTTCDYWGLRDEAIQCYLALQQGFPDTLQAEQAAAPLRRLSLPGKKLDLGGPTLDGGFLQVADFKGSSVLIVFWSSQAKPFVDQVSSIVPTITKHEKNGLQIISVNLDLEESALDVFMEKAGIGWRTIFHADKSLRGWNHPVAAYYGVRNVPQFWLVDKAGSVVSTTVQASNLDAELTKHLQ
ncbi:MAG: TlpA disulfide reductase family protein [Planctomycetota bacterium]|nr:TlpA disulfide reductase family protein [Planctomycetota bacterium]MDA1249352.1 TlpA disulfide reductase family protein [Planctomycetota bacterium]